MVYPIILFLHNALRWLVLGSLLAALFSSYSGWFSSRPYRPLDRAVSVLTTSLAHTQLLVGLYLYTISPIVSYYWTYKPGFGESTEFPFFGLIHGSLMFIAIVVMTVGASKAKRQTNHRQRFRTTAVYFTIGLLLIGLSIPWPFSPLASRPWIRGL